LHADRLVRQGTESAELILCHIRGSQILQSVVLFDEGVCAVQWPSSIQRTVTSRLARLFFQAITEHQLSNIVELVVTRWSFLEGSQDLFAYFMQSSQVLRKLTLFVGTDLRAAKEIEEAFRSNTTLECLGLYKEDEEDDDEVVTGI
jgi:hypothetical protein